MLHILTINYTYRCINVMVMNINISIYLVLNSIKFITSLLYHYIIYKMLDSDKGPTGKLLEENRLIQLKLNKIRDHPTTLT